MARLRGLQVPRYACCGTDGMSAMRVSNAFATL